jgi:hypothetical protein
MLITEFPELHPSFAPELDPSIVIDPYIYGYCINSDSPSKHASTKGSSHIETLSTKSPYPPRFKISANA